MLDHEHKSGETCSDSIKTLSDISSGFNNDETDSVAYLKQYKTLLQSICNCLYTSAHETLPGLSGVLQEGIDLLINEKRALTEYEFSFLQTIPEIFSEYVFIPESKVPDARLLSHLKNRQWIRPLSNEEEKAFIQLLMSPPAKSTKAPETVSEKSTTIEPKESHTPQNNTEPFPGQIKADRNTETGTAFIEKNTLKLVETEAGSNDTKAPHKKNSIQISLQKTEINLTEQQQELISLVCEELEETIKDKTLCHIPDKLNAIELNSHLLDISELIEDTSKAIDMIPLQGLSNSCRVIAINISALASAKTTLSEQHKFLIEEWPLNILHYLQCISNKSDTPLTLASKIIIQYLSDNNWPAVLTDNDKSALQSLLQNPAQKETGNGQQNASTGENNAPAGQPSTQNVSTEETSFSEIDIPASDTTDIEEIYSINEDPAAYNISNNINNNASTSAVYENRPENPQDFQVEQKRLEIPQTEQQQALSALVCEELEETIEDATLCSVPADISPGSLSQHLIEISDLIEDTSKAIDMIALEGLSNSCRFISINIQALAKNNTELSEQQKHLIEKWPAHVLLYMQSIRKIEDNNNEARHLVEYLSDHNWPVPLPADEVTYLQSLLTLSSQNEHEDIKPATTREDSAGAESAPNMDMTADIPPDNVVPGDITPNDVILEAFSAPASALVIEPTDDIVVNTPEHSDIIIDADELIAEHIEAEELQLPEDNALTSEHSSSDDNNSDEDPSIEPPLQIISEQQKEAISLVSDELNEIIEDEALCKIALNISAAELNDRLINIAQLIEHISNAIDMLGLEGLGNSCRVIAININTFAANRNDLTEQQKNLVEEWPLHILLYLQSISDTDDYQKAASNKTGSLIQYLGNDSWPYTLESDDKENLQALLSSPELIDGEDLQQHLSDENITATASPDQADFSQLHADSEITDGGTDNLNDTDLNANKASSEQIDNNVTISTDEPHSSVITKEQEELITLISDELNDIIEDETFCKAPENIGISELGDHLISIAELIEHMSNAIDMIGLEGLGNSCRIVSSNIHTLSLEKKHLTEQQNTLIEKWPSNILLYLQGVVKGSISEEDANKIILYVTDSSWPQSIQTEDRLNLQSLLCSPHLKEEEKDIRQNTANESDISLLLPGDVNAELLEALLQDLPVQTEEFSNALENMQTQNDMEYLDVAQRIAHTLKGASNVVGVKGIANLTHHLEDILEIQSKENKLPSAELQTILSDAADCLETMSENLLGISGPPDNALEVFQSILDWANKLDIEGATDSRNDTPGENPPRSLFAIKTDNSDIAPLSPANHPANHPAEVMLRVPATLADELLRLTGENLISTSQIQEYLKTIKNRYRGMKTHNQSLQKLSFDLEHIIDIQGILNNRQTTDNDNFDPLELNEFHELHAMSRQMVELAADSIELSQILEKDLSQLQGLVISQDKLQKESQTLVLKTRMVPTKSIIPRLKRGVKQACRLTNKHVELEVQHNDTQMDSEVLQRMIEPLMHILRNAVDHGIEPVEQRTDSGKPSAGLIKLTFTREGDQIKIEIQDDGQGLSIEKIKNKAIKLGLIDENKEPATANLQMLILHPGFSTRNEVNQVSGRGIGLDVVNTNIRELKGSLEINSTHGHGCTFTLLLPVSSFSTQALLIRVRENTHTFSNRGIEEILYPGNGKILNLGHEIVFKYNGKIYNTCFIEELLNLPDDRRGINRHSCPVILIKEDTGGNMAVLVQEVIDSQNVVVKSMGPYIPKLPGIVGATVLGDGSISPVIDIPELLQSAAEIPEYLKQQKKSENTPSTPQHLAYVLVVDDSLSARKSLAQFVEDLGMEVRTARDGMEAISLIAARKPDLLLVDMEMPRMNGLELTSHVRADNNTHDIPVIMITSRSTEKHRQTAISRGVDHYMVKPFEEEELASHIQGVLRIA